MKATSLRAGFSLVELVALILTLALLGGTLVPRISARMAETRDVERLRDVEAVRGAIELYRAEQGHYPAPNTNGAYGGWDVSHDGDFIAVLAAEGYLPAPVADPINDATYHFRYYVYEQGAYGCLGEDEFYVLGVRNFETQQMIDAHPGSFLCASRDWSSEFDYVTGNGATMK